MQVTLYTTFCPKCKVLESKLKQKNLDYEEITDMDIMKSKGIMSVPVLEVDGEMMDFANANKWINERN